MNVLGLARSVLFSVFWLLLLLGFFFTFELADSKVISHIGPIKVIAFIVILWVCLSVMVVFDL